jgi:hypothetical protein
VGGVGNDACEEWGGNGVGHVMGWGFRFYKKIPRRSGESQAIELDLSGASEFSNNV